MPKMIFVNLPVAGVEKSVAFYEAIGFIKDERFSQPGSAGEDQIRNWLLEQGLYQRSGTNLLKIAVDDALAFRDAFQDRYEAAVAGAQGNETLVHLISFADDVDVLAKLT